jgi:2-desacetyl-2-hydroxyethyl bacteriochlorophyllide A dehydrogenase
MLDNKKIVFKKSWDVGICAEPLDDSNIPPGKVLLKKQYSIVSTGTELACLSGIESWFRFPSVPGYSCVGEIVKIGEDVEGYGVGDRIFCYGSHSLYELISVDGLFLKAPAEIDSKWVPFVRMATVAATAIRASDIEWGDYVVVTGQGLVGNMAMQLAKLPGAFTIAVDMEERRLEYSVKCGADLTIDTSKRDAADEIKEFTRGEMAGTLIEATGSPAMAAQAIEWVGKNGEMILLGTPRGEYGSDLTRFIGRTHLASHNVTLKGAHEWRYPIRRDPFAKHSLERNSIIVMDLMQKGRLLFQDLLTEAAKPDDCARVYSELRGNKGGYMGVLFDWR